jgi:IS30 family transposase
MPNIIFSLTEEEVTEIKKLLWAGNMTQQEIADQFDVSQSTISHIVWGHSWPSIKWPDEGVGAMNRDYLRLLRKKMRRGGKRPRRE